MTEETDLQKCSDCRSTKLLETYFSKNVKGLYMKTCDRCREKRKVRSKNPKIKAQNKTRLAKWRTDNPEKYKQQYTLNKERILAQRKERYYADPEKARKASRDYAVKNREKVLEKKKVQGRKKTLLLT